MKLSQLCQGLSSDKEQGGDRVAEPRAVIPPRARGSGDTGRECLGGDTWAPA